MNTEELIQDAQWMLDTIEQCHSEALKATAARQLVDIAVEIAAQYYVPAPIIQPGPVQPEPAEDRPVIDLAMKYRTRDGREVTDLQDDGTDHWPISGIIKGNFGRAIWGAQGNFWSEKEDAKDLIPTGEPV